MFYLKHFFNVITFKALRGFLFCTLTLAVVMSVFFNKEINTYVTQVLKQKNTGPYFHALLSAEQNSSRISRKLKGLPGVKAVNLVGEREIKKQIKDIVQADQLNLDSSLFDLDMVGIKVEFATGLSARSQDLIRDYLIRLVGKNNVSLGAVKAIAEKIQTKKFIFFISKWGGDIVTFFILSLWYLCFLFMVESFEKSSYLVEQFQRRSYVSLKTFIASFSVISIVSFATFYLSVGKLSFAVLFLFAPLIIGVAHFSRKYQWEN